MHEKRSYINPWGNIKPVTEETMFLRGTKDTTKTFLRDASGNNGFASISLNKKN